MSKTDSDNGSGSNDGKAMGRAKSMPRKLVAFGNRVIKHSRTHGDLTDTTLYETSNFTFGGSDTQLSPTQPSKDLLFGSPKSNRSRTDKFCRVFPDIKETVINSYHCALVDDMLFQGVLYVTKNWFCFHSKLIGKKSVKIPVNAVSTIVKMNTALIIPNAIGIYTDTNKYVFGSLMARRSTYQVLLKVWQEAGARTLSTSQQDDVFDISNNNNPSKAFRHSRHLSEETNNSHTTSASDDASYSPDPAACDQPDQDGGLKRTADDRDDSDRDVPDGLDSSFQPTDYGRGDTADGPRSSSVVAGATNASKQVADPQLPAAANVKKRHRSRPQVLGGAAPTRGDLHGSTSAIGNGVSVSNAHLTTKVPREEFRPSNCALLLIAVTIVLLLLSAVFMALKLVHLQAQQEVFSTMYSGTPDNTAATDLKTSGEEIYRLRHERHRAVVDRLHTMTEAHVQLLDKVKKSLEELSDVADKTRYHSLTDDFDQIDNMQRTATPITSSENDNSSH